jgi:hypothetical protein
LQRSPESVEDLFSEDEDLMENQSRSAVPDSDLMARKVRTLLEESKNDTKAKKIWAVQCHGIVSLVHRLDHCITVC